MCAPRLIAGNKLGQSTVIRHWRFEDGTAGGPNAPEPAVSENMLQEAEAAAMEQVSATALDSARHCIALLCNMLLIMSCCMVISVAGVMWCCFVSHHGTCYPAVDQAAGCHVPRAPPASIIAAYKMKMMGELFITKLDGAAWCSFTNTRSFFREIWLDSLACVSCGGHLHVLLGVLLT